MAASVTVEFVEEPVNVKVDFSRLTWGDLLKLQRRGDTGSDEEAEKLMTDLISKLTGQDAYDLPAYVVAEIIQQVMARAQGNSAKN